MIEKLNLIEAKAGEIRELFKRLQELSENRKASIQNFGDSKEILKLIAESILLEMSIESIKCFVEVGEDLEKFNLSDEFPNGKEIFELLQYWDSYEYNSVTRNFLQHLKKDTLLQLVYSM